jgi:hypothetical protein
MTPEQTAIAQLDLSKLQLWVTTFAIFLGPLAGVLFTLWFQKRKENRDAQYQLFQTLMKFRRSNPPVYEWVDALNLIDVVFAKHRVVVNLWHQHYDLLCQNPVNWHLADAKYLDLLAAIAKALGYENLLQTDISRFYSPQAHGDQALLNYETQAELLRVLKGTASISIVPKADEKT